MTGVAGIINWWFKRNICNELFFSAQCVSNLNNLKLVCKWSKLKWGNPFLFHIEELDGCNANYIEWVDSSVNVVKVECGGYSLYEMVRN